MTELSAAFDRIWRATGGAERLSLPWYRALLDALPEGEARLQAILRALDVQAYDARLGDGSVVTLAEMPGGRALNVIDPQTRHLYLDPMGDMVTIESLRAVPNWAGIDDVMDEHRDADERFKDIARWQRERDRTIPERLNIEIAIICHRQEWNKWPDTSDFDYSAVLASRRSKLFIDPQTGREIMVTFREWPVFLSFFRSTSELPYRYPPHLDNSVFPSERVMAQQRQDLTDLAKDGVKVVLWEHGYGCYPPVAQILRDTFPFAILQFADDAYGSSEVKTLPVAGCFHAYFHSMGLMDFDTGEKVPDLYYAKGVDRCYFRSSTHSAGLVPWCQENKYTLEKRVTRLREWKFDIDLVFIGAVAGSRWRQSFLHMIEAQCQALALDIRGNGTRQGLLEPRAPAEGDGYIIAPYFARAQFGLNPQWSSIWNTRFFDFLHMGLPQCIFDPHGELAEEGYVGDEHYIPFDGTHGHLLRRVLEYKDAPERSVAMAVAGRVKAEEDLADKGQVFPRALFDAWEKIR